MLKLQCAIRVAQAGCYCHSELRVASCCCTCRQLLIIIYAAQGQLAGLLEKSGCHLALATVPHPQPLFSWLIRQLMTSRRGHRPIHNYTSLCTYELRMYTKLHWCFSFFLWVELRLYPHVTAPLLSVLI